MRIMVGFVSVSTLNLLPKTYCQKLAAKKMVEKLKLLQFSHFFLWKLLVFDVLIRLGFDNFDLFFYL